MSCQSRASSLPAEKPESPQTARPASAKLPQPKGGPGCPAEHLAGIPILLGSADHRPGRYRKLFAAIPVPVASPKRVRARPRKKRLRARTTGRTFCNTVSDMSKPIPSIQKYMTTSPHTVGTDQTLAHAHAVLREHKIRHLPVLRGGDLVGMLTDRDLALIETLKDVDPSKVLVEDAMSTGVYTVSPEAPLDEVVSEMATKKYGSAVVVHGNRVVGIFTNVDVCKAFSELLNSRLAK